MSGRRRPGDRLLALFPPRFRERFGRDFLDDLERRRREPRFEGARGRLRFALYVGADLAVAVPGAWAREAGRLLGSLLQRGPRALHGLSQDLRVAVRSFRRGPSFFLSAALTLSVGIAAATAIFSVVDGVILRPLPYEDPHELVRLGTLYESLDRMTSTSPPDFRDWQERTRTLESVAASRLEARTLLGEGEPRRVETACVSAGFFGMLGVRPAWGRIFAPSDDRPGAASLLLAGAGFAAAWFPARRATRLDPANTLREA